MTTTISFSMTLVRARAVFLNYLVLRRNLVLVVALVLESKDL